MKIMTKEEESCFNSFDNNNFKIIVNYLLNQGYVTDLENTSLVNMTQLIFNKLCDKFDIKEDINIGKYCGFNEKTSNYTIVYDKDKLSTIEAEIIVNDYINTIND